VSVVCSVTAERALASSTRFLPAAQAAISAEMESRLIARGLPRLEVWINAMASSVNRGSARPASWRWRRDVAGGFLAGHAGHVAAYGDALFERGQGAEFHFGGQGGLSE